MKIYLLLLLAIATGCWAGTWCEVDDQGNEISCGMGRSFCVQAVRGGIAADCIYKQTNDSRSYRQPQHSDNYNISLDTTRAQEEAAGLNPGYTSRR